MSNARLLLYAILGYAIAGQWKPLLVLLNTLALLGLLMFQRPLNDYWDFRLTHEHNPLAEQIRAGSFKQHHAVLTILSPLAICLPLICFAHPLGVSWVVPMLLCVGVLLSLGYSTPPIRIKTRRPWGALIAPTLTSLMFLEAHLVLAPLRLTAWLLVSLLWVFQLYAELVQVVALSPMSRSKCSPVRALAGLRWLPGISALLATVYACIHPIFSISILGSLIRWRTVRSAGAQVRHVIRQGHGRMWSPVLWSYEFAGYLIWGLTRAFGLSG